MVSRFLGGLFLPGGGYASGGKAVLRYGDDAARHADEAYTFVRWGDEAAQYGDNAARQADEAEKIRVTGRTASHNGGGIFGPSQKRPYTPELPPIGQVDDYSCAQAACDMMFQFEGKNIVDLLSGRKRPDMVNYLNANGLDVVENDKIRSIDELRRLMKGKPAIFSMPVSEGNHAIIIDRIDASMVYIRDPEPVNEGSAYAVTIDDFLQAAGSQSWLSLSPELTMAAIHFQ